MDEASFNFLVPHSLPLNTRGRDVDIPKQRRAVQEIVSPPKVLIWCGENLNAQLTGCGQDRAISAYLRRRNAKDSAIWMAVRRRGHSCWGFVSFFYLAPVSILKLDCSQVAVVYPRDMRALEPL